MFKKLAQIALSVFFVMGLMGCADEIPASQQAVAIDVHFSEFYTLMGGVRTLGDGIGPVFQNGTRLMQFTENSLMSYDEILPLGERFNFEPLGTKLPVADPGLPLAENQPGSRYLNGHVIFANFTALYDQLGGVRFVGKPLSDVRLNQEKNRYEQYFEKMGFFQVVGDTNEQVSLLPYGLIVCRQSHPEQGCSTQQADAIIEADKYLPEPFIAFTQRMGSDFSGQPLSRPFTTPDGLIEQIYGNIALVVDPKHPETIHLRNLPELTGMQTSPMTNAIQDQLMAFLPIDPATNLGHNVPVPFLEYIANHGGAELSGIPTSELFDINGIRRQCFTNYCLDYDPVAPANAQIRPAPLGRIYLGLQNYTPARINLSTWETYPSLPPGKEQIVGVMVYNTTPSQPMKDIEPSIEISLPDGSTQSFRFPPTSASGTAYLSINLPKVASGETVTYKVCVSQPGSTDSCSSESWLVW